MAFCSNCGAEVTQGSATCSKCGKPQGVSAGAGTAAAPAPAAAPSTGLADNVAGLLCYSPVGIIADIVFLVTEPYKSNKFVRFHAFQSLFMCAAFFGLGIALMILGMVLSFLGPLALLMIPLNLVIAVGEICLCVFMMIKAYGNNKTMLPIVGTMAEQKANAA